MFKKNHFIFLSKNYILKVLECVSSLLKTDPAVEVKRAAAMFITLLLQGVAESAIKVREQKC